MTDKDNSDSKTDKIRDPEEYVNHRRLENIFDIRTEIKEERKKVKIASHSRKFTRFETLSAYRTMVESYIIETESLLRSYSPGPELLNNKNFGTVTLSVTTEQRRAPGRGSNRTQQVYVGDNPSVDREWIPAPEVPEPKKIDLVGLLSLVNTPDPITATYELEVPRKYRTGKTFKHTVRGQISFRTLDTMVRTVNDFLSRIGFEVDPEPEDNPAQI